MTEEPERIETLQRLGELALERRAVIAPNSHPWNRRSYPAAFIMNLQGTVINRILKTGLYVYEKKGKNA
jgi:hypothetical protein